MTRFHSVRNTRHIHRQIVMTYGRKPYNSITKVYQSITKVYQLGNLTNYCPDRHDEVSNRF